MDEEAANVDQDEPTGVDESGNGDEPYTCGTCKCGSACFQKTIIENPSKQMEKII